MCIMSGGYIMQYNEYMYFDGSEISFAQFEQHDKGRLCKNSSHNEVNVHVRLYLVAKPISHVFISVSATLTH